MRPRLSDISVNDLGYRKFTLRKPANDTKPGVGRYVGGHAERNMKFSRCWRNGIAGASKSLTKTSPKSW